MFDQAIVLSEIDFVRLQKLSQEGPIEGLTDVLDQADITNCACISDDLVTMNSKITYQRLGESTVNELTIVYPHNVNTETHHVSVLSPLGRAFIGHHIGDTVSCELPDGEIRHFKILDVLYQPEARGDFHL